MNRYRYLALPAYMAAAALIIIPFSDALLTLYPWRPGTAQWRFGAIGLMSNAFMVPTVGILIALTTALMLGHFRALRVLGVICGLAAVGTVLTIGLFGLDAIQSSANVNPAAKLSFKVASITAALKLLLATGSLVAVAIAGLRTQRDRPKAAAAATNPLAAQRAVSSEAVVAG